jgi:FtsP/CotA-like multicopper oxidase with cupredoxin domain
MHTSKFKWMRLAMVLVLGLLALSPFASVQPVQAAGTGPTTGIICTEGPSFNLTAQSGYIQMSDMNTVYMWSYGTGTTSGNFQYPGPVLCVNEGDTVDITLKNELPYSLPTSLIFPGQENVMADGVLAQPDIANGSLTNSVANGASVTYSFVATRAGTFIYESGTDTKTQVPMGLASVLIVRPSMGANFVYNRASDQFTPEEEFMAFLSEVDPYQHAAWEKSFGKGKNYNLNNYHAYYWLLNGRGFPDTMADNNASWLPNQPYGALARIHPFNDDPGAGIDYHPNPALERFINVGTEEYPFHPHGQNGQVVSRDGYPLEGPGGQDMAYENFLVNIGPGQTWDVLFAWHDAENYSPSNPVNVTVPDLNNVTIGMFYSGSPYLGYQQTMPPGTTTLNQCGEYYIISHNHALFQLDAFGQTLAGPITYLRIDPPLAQQQSSGLLCP